MGVHTTIRPTPPIALLRALPPGPLAREYQRLKRLAELFERFSRADMEASVELLLAEMDHRDGDPDLEDGVDQEAISEREPDVDAEPMLGAPEIASGHWGGYAHDTGLDDEEPSDRGAAMHAHRDRIRKLRCRVVTNDYGGHRRQEFRLTDASDAPAI